jgi:DNA-directed RNA polymerase subunit RPC12/RpoP
MADPILYEATYQWACPACDTEVLAIRRNEKAPLTSAACPACGIRILVSPTVRREQRRTLIAASEVG